MKIWGECHWPDSGWPSLATLFQHGLFSEGACSLGTYCPTVNTPLFSPTLTTVLSKITVRGTAFALVPRKTGSGARPLLFLAGSCSPGIGLWPSPVLLWAWHRSSGSLAITCVAVDVAPAFTFASAQYGELHSPWFHEKQAVEQGLFSFLAGSCSPGIGLWPSPVLLWAWHQSSGSLAITCVAVDVAPAFTFASAQYSSRWSDSRQVVAKPVRATHRQKHGGAQVWTKSCPFLTLPLSYHLLLEM